MKFLIWFFALGIPGFITILLDKIGIHIGGFLPAVILYSIAFIAAKLLCKKWDLYSVEKTAKKAGLTTFDYVKSKTPAVIINHLESEKSCPEELKAYLDNYVKAGSMDRISADILIEGYTK